MSTESLFVAAFPDPECQDGLERLAQDVVASLPRLRLVKPGRRHLTVLFLGRHDQPQPRCIDSAVQVLGSLQINALEFMLDRVITLGHPRRPAVAVAATRVPEELLRIREELSAALCSRCPRSDQAGAFKPHVTLAYAADPVKPCFDPVEVLFRPARLCLVRSIQGQSAYRILATRDMVPGSFLEPFSSD